MSGTIISNSDSVDENCSNLNNQLEELISSEDHSDSTILAKERLIEFVSLENDFKQKLKLSLEEESVKLANIGLAFEEIDENLLFWFTEIDAENMESFDDKATNKLKKSLDDLDTINSKFIEEKEFFLFSREDEINSLVHNMDEYSLSQEEAMLYEDIINRFKYRKEVITDSFEYAEKNIANSRNRILDELYEIDKHINKCPEKENSSNNG